MKAKPASQAKTIGYVRSNSHDPDGETSLLEQISKIRATGVSTIVCDVASASDADRQGLKILLKLAESGQICEVVVTRWDRLLRNSRLYSELSAAFRAANISIQLIDQGKNCFPVTGSVIHDLFNSISQQQDCQSNGFDSPGSDLPNKEDQKE
ncbi:MAG: recombinase family protein [Cyanobacteria bacterium CAN_BIN43]|nr:recombinase family protein [Cyanobacteria bacterium CAN_BIN43]